MDSTSPPELRPSRVREWGSAGLLSLILGLLAVNHSGFSAVAWGWAALALLSLAVAALLFSTPTAALREVVVVGLLFALFAWTLLSATWASSATHPLLEAERIVVYVAGALAALLLGHSHRPLVVGTWAAVTAVCGYSLSTRLFSTRLGVFDPIAGERLSEPLGYWNALGVFAAMGLLISLGLVLHATNPVLRVAAGSTTVVLATTLYFTFSRGAWISLGAGLLALLALERRRLRALAALLVIAPWPAADVWLASQSEALTELRMPTSAAAADGRRLAIALAALAVAAGLAAFVFAAGHRRFQPPRRVRAAFAGLVVLAVVASVATIFVVEGSPPTVVRKAYDAFVTPSPFEGRNPNERFFTLSAGERIPHWRVAWKQYRLHPWLGAGAGTYEEYWLRYRPSPAVVEDAHNLYLETLAELGPVGLALLVVAFAVPLGAAVRARDRAFVSGCCGAYVAFLVDSAGEWNWELPAVTLTALFAACALLVAARREDETARTPTLLSPLALLAALGLAAFSFLGLIGNSALRASADAVRAQDLDRADSEARKATRWAPWSSEPWQRVAEAQVSRGDREAARRSLRRAIAKAPEDWDLWYTLALVSSGQARRYALTMASRRNPLAPEIATLKARDRSP